jgi:hypothetical protein
MSTPESGRRWVGPLVALCTVVLAVPAALGVLVRREHTRCVARLAEEWEGRLAIRTQSYSPGWFTSRAVLVVEPVGAGRSAAQSISETIAHGPLPWLALAEGRAPELGLAELRGEWRPDLPALVKAQLGDRPPLRFGVRVGFDRRARVEVESPALSGQGFEWGGVQGSGEFASEGGSLRVAVPQLHWTGKGEPLRLQDVRAELRTRAAQGLMLEEWTGSLGSLEIGAPGRAQIASLAKLTLGQTSEERDGRVNIRVRSGFERAAFSGEEYRAGALEIGILNVDSVVLSVLRARMHDARGGEAKDGAKLAAVTEAMSAWLQSQPVLEVARLHVDTPMGPLDGRGRVWWDALPEGVAGDPSLWFALMRVDARLVTPTRLAHRFVDQRVAKLLSQSPGPGSGAAWVQAASARAELFSRWREEGVLQSEGDAYVMRVQLGEDRQLRLNGVVHNPMLLAQDVARAAQRTRGAGTAPGATP